MGFSISLMSGRRSSQHPRFINAITLFTVMAVFLQSAKGHTFTSRENFGIGDDIVGFLSNEDSANLLLRGRVVFLSQLAHITMTSLKCFICRVESGGG